MHRLTIGLATLLLAPALAQELPDEPEAQEIRRYTVEVIVFEYSQDVATGSEVFLPDEPEPELLPLEDSLVFTDEPAAEPAEEPAEELEEAEPLPDIELVLLDEEDYQLGEEFGRLERLQAYEPLMHFGWTQATWPQEETEPLPLFRFARPPEGLDGSLTLYLSRYLHLVVDLQLAAPVPVDPEALPVYYRIEENRILKNGERRYFDHPKFGVLALVTRVEDEEDEEPGEGELLGYPVE